MWVEMSTEILMQTFFFYIIRNGCAMILNGHIVYASSADSYQTWEEERGLIANHKGFFWE